MAILTPDQETIWRVRAYMTPGESALVDDFEIGKMIEAWAAVAPHPKDIARLCRRLLLGPG